MGLVDPNGKPLKRKDAHKDQKLVVDFIRNAQGNDCITISFEPEIPEVRTAAQAAAVNVANHIIRSFGLDQGDKQNAESSEKAN